MLNNACQECRRQFVENPTRQPMADETEPLQGRGDPRP
jgi:hypothetical protein